MSLYSKPELEVLEAAVRKTAKELHTELMNALLTAPVRRGWNPVFRKPIPSASELKREFNRKIQDLDEQLVAMGGDSIIEPEANVEPIKIKVEGD